MQMHERFQEFEKAHHLFHKRVTDVEIWQYIRFIIFFQILKKSGIFETPHTATEEGIQRIGQLPRLLYNSLCFHPTFFKKPVDLLVFGSNSKVKLTEEYWDIFTDFFLDELPFSSQVIEFPRFNGHCRPTVNKNIRYFDWYLISSFFQRSLPAATQLSHEDDHFVNELDRALNTEFNVDLNIPQLIRRTLRRRYRYLKAVRSLLQHYKPRLVMEVCSYDPLNQILNEVCASFSIPTIELQHGLINSFHIGYNFPPLEKQPVTFPKYMFTFGEYWHRVCNWCIPDENLIPIGSPYMEYQWQKVKAEPKDQVLFISQGTIGRELSKLAVDLSEKLPSNMRLVYKLHPGEYERWKEIYPWLLEKQKQAKIDVIDTRAKTIYDFFGESRYQVGVYSTAIFEGLCFGLHTFIVCLPGYEYMDDLIDNNQAYHVNTADELFALINKAGKDMDRKVNPEYFFKRNSLKNIQSAVTELMCVGNSGEL